MKFVDYGPTFDLKYCKYNILEYMAKKLSRYMLNCWYLLYPGILLYYGFYTV